MTDPVRNRESDGQGGALPDKNPNELTPVQDPLPKFIIGLPNGLHVLLTALDSPALFHAFIDRTFSAGLRFAGLDYDCMHKLLYECESVDHAKMAQELQNAGRPPALHLADGIVLFPPQRQRCYRDPKLVNGGREAEYLFEPIMLESVIEEPIFGDPGPDGNCPVVNRLLKAVATRATLHVDEFIAAMWCKGVRYGIDIAAVHKAISGNKVERLVVARMKPPTPGQNASLAELTRSLHRDDSPKLLADGRIDLHHFQNHFPQVAKNTKLLRKIPRVLGKSGWDIAGNEIAPEIPQDFDIAQMSGPGTRIEHTGAGEFVVADMSGFLQVDTKCGLITINDKIVNREGVGLHTTGNLTLDGDEYEEHGEVQELSKVEGKHMTFQECVFGNIVSHGGRVVLKKSLNAGSVRNPEGSIIVEGITSRAVLEAVGGEITLGQAEGCTIIGKKVRIARAIQCDVLAEELTVEVSEGSALAAQRLHVGTAQARREAETAISILIPDLTAITRQLDELKHKQSECEQVVAAKTHEIDAIASQQEVKNYSIIFAKLTANEVHMTAEQSTSWQKLVTKVNPALRQLRALNDELRAARAAVQDTAGKIERLSLECQAMSTAISCNVETIAGDTVIRTLKIAFDAAPLHTISLRELRVRLRESGTDCEILFSGSEGEFTWVFSEKTL